MLHMLHWCPLPELYCLNCDLFCCHVPDKLCVMQITDGAILGSSVKGFTGTPPVLPPAAPNSGVLVVNSTSGQGCEMNVFAPPCLNPVAFIVNSTALVIKPTDTDFCPVTDGDGDFALKISGERL